MRKTDVIVVGQDSQARALVAGALDPNRYIVKAVESADKALSLFKETSFDLMVTELELSNRDGSEFIHAARQLKSDLILVVMTDRKQLWSAVESLRYGAAGYLVKPLVKEDVCATVDSAAIRHRHLTERVRLDALLSLFKFSRVLMTETDVSTLLEVATNLIKQEIANALVEIRLFRYDQAKDIYDSAPPHTHFSPSAGPFPLTVQDRQIGIVSVSLPDVGTSLTGSDVEFLTILCREVATAIRNAQLYRRGQENYMQTMLALVSAVEIKDPYSHGHASRVAKYTTYFAEKLNLSRSEKDWLVLAAMLHDVGKIGLSDDLLSGGLSMVPDAHVQMKEHPKLAVRILDPIGLPADVLSAILHHHERWDGAGYPDGLTHQSIPFGARVIAITNVMDAMQRAYPGRSVMAFEEIKNEIHREGGKQFDPSLVSLAADVEEICGEPTAGNRTET